MKSDELLIKELIREIFGQNGHSLLSRPWSNSSLTKKTLLKEQGESSEGMTYAELFSTFGYRKYDGALLKKLSTRSTKETKYKDIRELFLGTDKNSSQRTQAFEKFLIAFTAGIGSTSERVKKNPDVLDSLKYLFEKIGNSNDEDVVARSTQDEKIKSSSSKKNDSDPKPDPGKSSSPEKSSKDKKDSGLDSPVEINWDEVSKEDFENLELALRAKEEKSKPESKQSSPESPDKSQETKTAPTKSTPTGKESSETKPTSKKEEPKKPEPPKPEQPKPSSKPETPKSGETKKEEPKKPEPPKPEAPKSPEKKTEPKKVEPENKEKNKKEKEKEKKPPRLTVKEKAKNLNIETSEFRLLRRVIKRFIATFSDEDKAILRKFSLAEIRRFKNNRQLLSRIFSR